MLPPDTLAGRVAIVTGGGTGLGRAMAGAFGALGARLVLASRSVDHLEPAAADLRAVGVEAVAVPTDVRDPDAVDRLIAAAYDRFGRLDILVNNAAGNFLAPTLDITPNGWRTVIDIVLNGTFYCSRAAGLRWRDAGTPGVILNILATYAATGHPGTAHSAAAKAGVLNLTHTLAAEWAAHRIRVVGLAPGLFVTPGAKERLFPDPAIEARIVRAIPAGRPATIEELADAACYLVSDYAQYVTGHVLTVDGGWSLEKGMGQYLPNRR